MARRAVSFLLLPPCSPKPLTEGSDRDPRRHSTSRLPAHTPTDTGAHSSPGGCSDPRTALLSSSAPVRGGPSSAGDLRSSRALQVGPAVAPRASPCPPASLTCAFFIRNSSAAVQPSRPCANSLQRNCSSSITQQRIVHALGLPTASPTLPPPALLPSTAALRAPLRPTLCGVSVRTDWRHPRRLARSFISPICLQQRRRQHRQDTPFPSLPPSWRSESPGRLRREGETQVNLGEVGGRNKPGLPFPRTEGSESAAGLEGERQAGMQEVREGGSSAPRPWQGELRAEGFSRPVPGGSAVTWRGDPGRVGLSGAGVSSLLRGGRW